MRQRTRVVRRLAEPCLRPGVGEDVGPLGDPYVGGYRDEGNTGDQAAGHRQNGGRRRRGQHGHQGCAGDPFGD